MYALGRIFVKVPFFVCCAHYSCFVTLILAGIIFYQVKTGVISKKIGAFYFAINYLISLLGFYLYDKRYIDGSEPYLISFMYAVMLFIMLPKLELKPNRVVSFFSEISFSVYLLQMTFGGLLLSLFVMKFRFSVSVLLTTFSVLVFSTMFCYFIEKPIRKLLRKI